MVWSIIKEGFEAMISSYSEFQGTGLYVVMFFLAVLFVSFSSKNNRFVKDALVKYPLYVLIVYFCPIWYLYTYLFSDYEILYRLLWLLPMGVVVCYSFTEIIFKLPEKKRTLAFVMSVIILVIGGEYTYANEYFSLAHNPYHVSQTTVEICDEIAVEGREIRAAFPTEMINEVRQYTSNIVLPYGREIFMGFGSWENELRTILESDVIDTERCVYLLRDTETPYLVISTEKNFTENLSRYDYVYVTSVGEYDIYLDNNAYIGTDFINYR